MAIFTFFWSPEGRPLTTIETTTYKEALAQFRQEFPEHSKYLGEVYVETV